MEGNGPIGQAEIDGGDTIWTVVGPTSAPFDEGGSNRRHLTRAAWPRWSTGSSMQRSERFAAGSGCWSCTPHMATYCIPSSRLSAMSARIGTAAISKVAAGFLEVISAVREAWPAELPLFVRVSAVDGVEGGWSLDDTIEFARTLRRIGVDVVDCSSGGMGGPATAARLPRSPGFQLEFAEAVRREAGIRTMGVGLIRTPDQAEAAIRVGQADLIAIGREALVDPNWALHALDRLAAEDAPKFDRWPNGVGWWLAQRERSIASSANVSRTTRGPEPQA